jgi:hypothetical protein
MSDIRLIDIVYDGATEPIHCEKISDSIYRCIESCIFIDFIKYGCEIEIEEKDGRLVFLGLYKESPYTVFFYVWSKEIVESKEIEKMKEEIMSLGGYWESAMGGFFIIHLPKENEGEINRLLELLKAE